jgi:hypothetical protein
MSGAGCSLRGVGWEAGAWKLAPGGLLAIVEVSHLRAPVFAGRTITTANAVFRRAVRVPILKGVMLEQVLDSATFDEIKLCARLEEWVVLDTVGS